MNAMRIEILSNLPEWSWLWIFPLITLSGMAILALIFRRIIPSQKLYDSDTDVVDTATQNSLSAAYVVMGFTLVLVMGTADTYDTNVMTEATQIESLDRLLIHDGSAQAKKMRTNLLNYAQSIVRDEWPDLEYGPNEKTTALMRELSDSLEKINPTTPKQSLLFTDITRTTNQIILSREIRALNAGGGLPQLFWTISYLYLFAVAIICALRLSHATPMRVIAITTQLTMLSLIFSAVMIIDHPFMGKTSASSQPLEKAIQIMQSR